MSSQDHRGQDDAEILGVFEDEQTAEAARARAQQAGADPSAIRTGEREDRVDAVRAEMREETERSFLSPQAGVLMTKEMTKGTGLMVPVAAAIGALVLLPLGFVEIGGLPLWLRLLGAAVAGAFAGGTVGAIVGGGVGAKGPAEPLASERGTTVRVQDGRREVADAMARGSDPIRLDRVDPGGGRIETVTTEEERSDEGTVESLGRKLRQGEGRREGHETQG